MLPIRSNILVQILFLFCCTPGFAIVGGEDADEGEFPWIAGIVRRDVFPGPGLVGGGALVGDQWVVTAAHSVFGLSPSNLEVWLNSTDLEDSASRQVYGVLSVVIHPGFAFVEPGASSNDIALLLLDRRVPGIAPLALIEDPADISEGDPVRVAGWGSSTPGEAAANPRLQKANAEIVDNSEAETLFGAVVEDTHLAALDPAGLATPCFGDSGGPLVKQIAGTDRLAGIVSFGGADCSDATIPTVYTRVPSYAAWTQARLALTAVPPRPRLRGRGRNIPRTSIPRLGNGSEIRLPLRRGGAFVRPYRVVNLGPGLLTIQSTSVGGPRFSLARHPARVLHAGASAVLRVRVRAPRQGRRFGGRIVLRTNDPARPVHVFRLAATRRPR